MSDSGFEQEGSAANLVEWWEDEIDRILWRKRDAEIRNLGSVKEYVEKLIARTESEEVYRRAFSSARRRLLAEWQIGLPGKTDYDARILDLLVAYPTYQADTVIIGYIKRRGRFSGRNDAGQDLHLKALTVLRSAFPSAVTTPEEPAAPFCEYLELLRQEVRKHEYCGYAAAQLIHLRQLSPDGQALKYIIKSFPESLQQLVATLLVTVNVERSGEVFGKVYETCLMLGSPFVERFEESIRSLGGRLKPGEIQISGTTILFAMSPEAGQLYSISDPDLSEHAEKIATALRASANPKSSSVLSTAYEVYLELEDDVPLEFEKLLSGLGAKMIPGDEGPVVVTNRGRRLELKLSPDGLERYLRLVRWNKDGQARARASIAQKISNDPKAAKPKIMGAAN